MMEKRDHDAMRNLSENAAKPGVQPDAGALGLEISDENLAAAEGMAPSQAELTAMLRRWTAGDQQAGNILVKALYRNLRGRANRALRRERANHTLQPTALVNEACLRLLDLSDVEWNDRNHFLYAAAKTMRRVLVDHARRRGSAKRGEGQALLPLEDDEVASIRADAQLEALDEALDRLAKLDRQKAELVELRYFGGFTVDQTAELMGLSRATVVRQWRLTRAWLRDMMA